MEGDTEEKTTFRDIMFEHDLLTAIIMLDEGNRGNTVSYDNASKFALALEREEENLPFHLLRKEN